MATFDSKHVVHCVVAAAAGAAATYVVCRLTGPRRAHPAWKTLETKAGGAHSAMMISDDGHRLLKPLDQGHKSEIEMRNYELLRRTPIGPFLSGFHGVKEVDGQQYMEIDSAYANMEGPCATLDIKIGKKTYDDNASEEKKKKEERKFNEIYARSSAQNGYRVAGMKAGDLKLSSAENLKVRCGVNADEFPKWVMPAFFANGQGYGPLPPGKAGTCQPDSRECEVDVQAAREILGQLKAFAAAAELGCGALRASSLLFTREMRTGGRWKMVLIDLTHYTPGKDRDANFCDGVHSLVRMWEAWCEPRKTP